MCCTALWGQSSRKGDQSQLWSYPSSLRPAHVDFILGKYHYSVQDLPDQCSSQSGDKFLRKCFSTLDIVVLWRPLLLREERCQKNIEWKWTSRGSEMTHHRQSLTQRLLLSSVYHKNLKHHGWFRKTIKIIIIIYCLRFGVKFHLLYKCKIFVCLAL